MQWNYSKLKGRFTERGLTRAHIAEEIGIAPSTLSLTLNNQREFTPTEIVHLCEFLEIQPQDMHKYFFCLEGFEKQN